MRKKIAKSVGLLLIVTALCETTGAQPPPLPDVVNGKLKSTGQKKSGVLTLEVDGSTSAANSEVWIYWYSWDGTQWNYTGTSTNLKLAMSTTFKFSNPYTGTTVTYYYANLEIKRGGASIISSNSNSEVAP